MAQLGEGLLDASEVAGTVVDDEDQGAGFVGLGGQFTWASLGRNPTSRGWLQLRLLPYSNSKLGQRSPGQRRRCVFRWREMRWRRAMGRSGRALHYYSY